MKKYYIILAMLVIPLLGLIAYGIDTQCEGVVPYTRCVK